MTSHHPTSAELAAFRYRIDPDAIDCSAWHHRTGVGRASDRELTHGIGERGWDGRDRAPGSPRRMAGIVRTFRHDVLVRAERYGPSCASCRGLARWPVHQPGYRMARVPWDIPGHPFRAQIP